MPMTEYRKRAVTPTSALPSLGEAILVNHGPFDPPHKGHVVMMSAARHRLECEGYIVIAAVLGIASKEKGTPSLNDDCRVRCIDLLVSDMNEPWISGDADAVKFESGDEMAAALRVKSPDATVFNVTGADFFEKFGVKCGMSEIYISRGGSQLPEERQGGDTTLVTEADAVTGDFSSIKLRQALKNKDFEALQRICGSAVTKYLLGLPGSSWDEKEVTLSSGNDSEAAWEYKEEGPHVMLKESIDGIPIVIVMHGSFNPVHSGHTSMMLLARRELELRGYRVVRCVFAITSRKHLISKGIKALEDKDRVECLRRACDDIKHGTTFICDKRGTDYGSSNEMLTGLLLPELENEYPGIIGFNLVGADTASRYQGHLRRRTVVIGREGYTDGVRRALKTLRDKKDLPIEPIVLDTEFEGNVSSTKVRGALLVGDEEAVYAMCPKPVADYLFATRLGLFAEELTVMKDVVTPAY